MPVGTDPAGKACIGNLPTNLALPVLQKNCSTDKNGSAAWEDLSKYGMLRSTPNK